MLGLLILIGFADVIFAGKTFLRGDFGVFSYPQAYYHRESIWNGELPLWNPYNFAGLPFMAQWNTMVFYPGTLFYILFPLPWSLGVFCLLHIFWAGLGMYLLCRQQTKHSLASGLAGVSFALGGLALSCLIWPSNVATVAWMPWVIWAVEEAMKGGIKPFLKACGIGAMQMLTGSPETIIFTWLIVGSNVLAIAISQNKGRWNVLLRLGCIILAVAALCAIQLLPFLELLQHSLRSSSYGKLSSMPLTGWANFFVPLFRCHESQYETFKQATQPWINSYYVGIGTIVLALTAIMRVKTRRVWLWTGLCVLGAWLALGKAGHFWSFIFQIFPALGYINFPIKFIILPAFLLPMLAALALAQTLNPHEDNKPKSLLKVVLLAGLFASLMIIALLGCEKLFPTFPKTWPILLKNAELRLLFLGAILGAVYLLTRKHSKLASVMLLLLVGADGLTHFPNQNPTIVSSIYEPHLQHEDMKPIPALGKDRAWLDTATQDGLLTDRLTKPETDLLGRRLMLFLNLNLLDNIPKWDGFFPLILRRFGEINYFLAKAEPKKSTPFFNFLGISFLPDANRTLAWKPLPGALPMMTCGQQPLFKNQKEIFTGIFATNFSPLTQVYLPEEAQSAIRATTKTDCRILQNTVKPHRIDAEIEASEPSMIVVAQIHFPAWEARVDGKAVPLFTANHAFQAFEVPAGRHRVELVYHDKTFIRGTWISAITLIICLGLWVWSARRRLVKM